MSGPGPAKQCCSCRLAQLTTGQPASLDREGHTLDSARWMKSTECWVK